MQHQNNAKSDSIDFWIYTELAQLEFLDPYFGPDGEVDHSSWFKPKEEYWPFMLARSFVHSLNLADRDSYSKWIWRQVFLGPNGNKHLFRIPASPQSTYREDWISWEDFLYSDCPLKRTKQHWPIINTIRPDLYFLTLQEYQLLRFQAARLSLYKQVYGHCRTDNFPVEWARMSAFLRRMQHNQDESLLLGVDGMLPDGLAEWGLGSLLYYYS